MLLDTVGRDGYSRRVNYGCTDGTKPCGLRTPISKSAQALELGGGTATERRGYNGEEPAKKHAFCETNPIVMLGKLHLYGLWRVS